MAEAEIVQANYDELEEIAARFAAQAEANENLSRQIKQRVQALQNGGWEGKGSQAFFTEMETEVSPAMERLSHALQEARSVTLQIDQILHRAEEEAALPLKGGDSGATGIIEGGGASPAGSKDSTDLSSIISTIGNGVRSVGDIFGIIDGGYNLFKLSKDFFANNPLAGLDDFLKYRGSLSGTFKDMFKTKMGAIGTFLSVAGAGFEGYEDLQSGQGWGEVITSESVELGLDVGIHALAMLNPISGGAMLAYDVASLVVPDEYWLDVDEATDWAGNKVYEAGEYLWHEVPDAIDSASDIAGDAVDAVGDFGAGVVDGIGSIF